jgi:hypothetical protein
MFRGLPTASLPITQLFNSPYLFTVPAYQRPYAWTTKEAGQLLEDLSIAAGLDDQETASPDYFLGTILLLDPEVDGTTPPGAPITPRVYEVVDGQQRLITISILASVLRNQGQDDSAADHGEEEAVCERLHAMISVKPDARDITGREARVQLRDSSQAFYETHVIKRGPRVAIADEDTALKGAGLKVVTEYITAELERLCPLERRKLGEYLMDYCHVVVIVSRDIDRAHRLFSVLNDRGKPLERKDIIKAEVLRAVPVAGTSDALALWDRAQSTLGPEYETFLGHLRLIHGLQRLPIILGVRTLVRDYGSERFLSEQLAPHAEAFNLVRNFAAQPGSERHPALSASLISLNRLGKADWIPAAILAMAQFHQAPHRSTQLMVQIERFAYLLRLLGYGAGKRQRRFAGIIADIRSGNPDAPIGPAWDITREELRTIAFHLKDLHRRNTAMSKLVLMRVEDEVAGSPRLTDPSDLTVEHILPMRPAATSDWKQIFPEAEQRAICQASLGNLALVTSRQNDRAKNKDFLEKRAVYLEHDATMPPLVSNEDVISAPAWGLAEILAREQRLLAIVARIWQIDVLPPMPSTSNGVRMFG